MDKESSETNTFSIPSTPLSANAPCSTVIKEPELVTIIEDMPLTKEQIEEEQDFLEEAEDEFEPNEGTPLLRSTETGFEKSGSSFLTHNSQQQELHNHIHDKPGFPVHSFVPVLVVL